MGQGCQSSGLVSILAPLTDREPLIAFGPEMPGWGSWEWIGNGLIKELSKSYRTFCYRTVDLSEADIVVVVKHPLPESCVEHVTQRAAIVYCPVDFYGNAMEIDGDGPMLRKCSRIIVHCKELRRYFAPYAPVEFVDHHVNFAAPMPSSRRREGYVLWVGVRTNLPPWSNG